MKPAILRTVLFLLVLTGCTTEVTGWYELPDSGDTNGNSDIDTDSDSDADNDSDADTDTASETESETGDTETETADTGDTESEWPTDTETDTETGTDTGDDTETDTGTDLVGDCTGPGVYFDAVNSLCWELSPPTTAIIYVDAEARCSTLVLDGSNDWRVPDINELQTLVQGCATPGCGVHDPGCLYEYCDDSCPVCSLYGGSGPGGCYWNVVFGADCGYFWSSSAVVGVAYNAHWLIGFPSASFLAYGDANTLRVRCARTP